VKNIFWHLPLQKMVSPIAWRNLWCNEEYVFQIIFYEIHGLLYANFHIAVVHVTTFFMLWYWPFFGEGGVKKYFSHKNYIKKNFIPNFFPFTFYQNFLLKTAGPNYVFFASFKSIYHMWRKIKKNLNPLPSP
jgi:hypothetical protein